MTTTTVTLKEHLETMIEALDKRVDQRFVAHEKADDTVGTAIDGRLKVSEAVAARAETTALALATIVNDIRLKNANIAGRSVVIVAVVSALISAIMTVVLRHF